MVCPPLGCATRRVAVTRRSRSFFAPDRSFFQVARAFSRPWPFTRLRAFTRLRPLSPVTRSRRLLSRAPLRLGGRLLKTARAHPGRGRGARGDRRVRPRRLGHNRGASAADDESDRLVRVRDRRWACVSGVASSWSARAVARREPLDLSASSARARDGARRSDLAPSRAPSFATFMTVFLNHCHPHRAR